MARRCAERSTVPSGAFTEQQLLLLVWLVVCMAEGYCLTSPCLTSPCLTSPTRSAASQPTHNGAPANAQRRGGTIIASKDPNSRSRLARLRSPDLRAGRSSSARLSLSPVPQPRAASSRSRSPAGGSLPQGAARDPRHGEGGCCIADGADAADQSRMKSRTRAHFIVHAHITGPQMEWTRLAACTEAHKSLTPILHRSLPTRPPRCLAPAFPARAHTRCWSWSSALLVLEHPCWCWSSALLVLRRP
jgi:hypothetical protein